MTVGQVLQLDTKPVAKITLAELEMVWQQILTVPEELLKPTSAGRVH